VSVLPEASRKDSEDEAHSFTESVDICRCSFDLQLAHRGIESMLALSNFLCTIKMQRRMCGIWCKYVNTYTYICIYVCVSSPRGVTHTYMYICVYVGEIR
jgi:hypothetical protein